MNAVVSCAVFVALFAVISAEHCRTTSACAHVTCSGKHYTLECHNGQCSCTHNTLTCTNKDDCTNRDDSCKLTWHCVDSKCRCGYGDFSGGK